MAILTLVNKVAKTKRMYSVLSSWEAWDLSCTGSHCFPMPRGAPSLQHFIQPHAILIANIYNHVLQLPASKKRNEGPGTDVVASCPQKHWPALNMDCVAHIQVLCSFAGLLPLPGVPSHQPLLSHLCLSLALPMINTQLLLHHSPKFYCSIYLLSVHVICLPN